MTQRNLCESINIRRGDAYERHTIAEPSGRKLFRFNGYKHYWTRKSEETLLVNAAILNDLCLLVPVARHSPKTRQLSFVDANVTRAKPQITSTDRRPLAP